MSTTTQRKDNMPESDIIGGFPVTSDYCAGCGKPLLVENAWMTDGCPCNSRLGVNSMNETRWRLLMELQQRQASAATPIDGILAEFKDARKAGQQKYGGDDPVGHDLDHRLTDWTRFIRDHLERACGPDAFVSLDQREHMVKAGGLLLSAIWALDVNAGRIPLKGCND